MSWRSILEAVAPLENYKGGDIAPATERQLIRAENSLGFSIPEQVRTLIAELGACRFKSYVRFPRPETFPEWASCGVESFCGVDEPEVKTFSLAMVKKNFLDDQRLPLELLPFAGTTSLSMICVGVAAKYRGKIYFWDEDMECEPDEYEGEDRERALWSNISLISPSLDSFIRSLVPGYEIQE